MLRVGRRLRLERVGVGSAITTLDKWLRLRLMLEGWESAHDQLRLRLGGRGEDQV